MNSDVLSWVIVFITLLIVMYGTWVIAYNHGLMDGMDMNHNYYEKLITWMSRSIEIRNDIIAKYRDISNTICNSHMSCNFCSYTPDNGKELCKLGELNNYTERFKISEIHVDNKYDRH